MTPGMSDIAYDISHLLEAELRQADAPAPRAAPAVRIVPAQPAPPGVDEVQKALARELMQAAAVHDALVQQYLRTGGETFCEPAADQSRAAAGTVSPLGPS
jgi:hypothetical protein